MLSFVFSHEKMLIFFKFPLTMPDVHLFFVWSCLRCLVSWLIGFLVKVDSGHSWVKRKCPTVDRHPKLAPKNIKSTLGKLFWSQA